MSKKKSNNDKNNQVEYYKDFPPIIIPKDKTKKLHTLEIDVKENNRDRNNIFNDKYFNLNENMQAKKFISNEKEIYIYKI